MVIPSILVRCVASSTDAFDQVLDLPEVVVQPFEGRLRWSDLQDRLSSRDRADTQRIPEGGTPGWTVLDLGWGVPLDHGSSVGVASENVFDVDYRRHGSGVNEPSRNLVVRFEQSF